MTAQAAILDRVARYYGDKVRAHGPTAAGADWKSDEQQALRFDQLLKVRDREPPYSLNDYGCGYGALVDTLVTQGLACDYRGFDICPEMIAEARRLYADAPQCRFFDDEQLLPPADYTVASGIFNVKGDAPHEQWTSYLHDTVSRIAARSRRGFAFNVLTKHVDFRRDDLYYADPGALLDHCVNRFSRRVSLLHDYGLYEFTLIVRL
jgi:SAM-dependent methyltransferase